LRYRDLLHCPPTEVYRQDSTFEALDWLQEAGKIRNYGVSVEKVEEAQMALDYPGVATVQIIFNVFRPKPAEEFFPLAEERNVGILARVPLASGLLSGKMRSDRAFTEDDHRSFNREGQAFDRGRRSQAWISRRDSGPRRNLRSWYPKETPSRSSPYVGSSCTPPSPAPSQAARTRRRSKITSPQRRQRAD
jgi:aryl-alcohol dehydrogenase-like predicted oxidoreductase